MLYKALLKRHGVRIVSLNEPIEDTPAGRMLEGMLEVLDEFYSANLAENTARGMRKNAQRGYYNGGTPPTGYLTERTGEGASPKLVLKPCPTFAPLIRRMYRMALEGNGGVTIARTLNGEGHRTLRGKLWTTQTVLMHRVFGRDVVSCPACGCRIWLVDQVVDPFSAQLELAVMGMPVQLVAFRPARGPPESLLP